MKLRYLVTPLFLAAACQTPTYEGRRVEMEFTSDPEGATVYLIRWTDWAEQSGEQLIAAYRAAQRTGSEASTEQLEQLLTTFQSSSRDEGVTPVRLEVVDYQLIYLAVLGERVGRTEVYPKNGGSASLVLQ